jgi:cob(I)alamin adenosyltransferase
MTDDAGARGRFSDPKLAINRIYTKKGDAGQTQLVGGQTASKDEPRIEAYGTVDELNAFVGVARLSVLEAAAAAPIPERKARLATLGAELLRVQHELFNLGAVLATLAEDLHPRQPRVTDVEVSALEASIDATHEVLAPLRSFVLPGGCRAEADLHVARTVCRRAERHVVALARTREVEPAAIRYLNRLSDAFFAWSRLATWASGADEVLWQPNAAASGQPR